jgi:hypothetical protein
MFEIVACHERDEAIDFQLARVGRLEYRCQDGGGLALVDRLGRDGE